MAVSTRTLRWVFAGGAVALLAVVLGFVAYAHWRAQAFLGGLAGRLGIHVTQETDNFTYSQSLKGRTVFTVHAAKAIQRQDGKLTLRNVGIVVYGVDGPGGAREDRIHGEEFEYDQKAGVLRAVGEALIDLAGPPGREAKAGAPGKVIHVKTIGLVFLQKEQSAATDGAVEFEANGLTGHSVGASYESKTGLVVLNSAVQVSGLRGKPGEERPMVLTAARAQMDQKANVLTLEGPKYVSATDAGAQTLSAAQAVVHTSEDGSPKDVEAMGRVVVTGDGRGTVTSERLDVQLNEAGQPRVAHWFDGVRFVEETPLRHEAGTARDAVVGFDGAGRPVHAVMTGAAEMAEKAGTSERRLNAEKVELGFSGGGKARLVLRSAVASGGDGARLRLVDATVPAKAGDVPGTSTTGIRADVLTGRFGPVGITGLDGVGKTFVERDTLDGRGLPVSQETSTGETLGVDLKPVSVETRGGSSHVSEARHGAPGAVAGKMALSRAVQRGGVEIMRTVAAAKPGVAAEVEHARAAVAVFDAEANRLDLSGGAQVADASSLLSADRVELDRASGDGLADGGVRVNYLQAGGKAGAEPVHVLAGRAVSHKATGLTEFTAAAGGTVRMWQAGSQVVAPAIDLDRGKKTMLARGAGAGADNAVRTTLVSDQAGKPATMVRVLSREMSYADAAREVEFRGKVRLEDGDGVLRSNEATVYLLPAGEGSAELGGLMGGLMGGKVERVVSVGAVDLVEPGRRATGDKLVYSAADETYVLTGTKAAEPKLVDEAKGTVTGASLRFRRGDDSVLVTGGNGGDEGARVRSQVPLREAGAPAGKAVKVKR